MDRREFLRRTIVTGLAAGLGCDVEIDPGAPLPSRSSDADVSDLTLVARFAHVTDTHLVDSLSPARFPAAGFVTRSAFRPWEAYSSHILDGIVRAVNRIHASGRSIDFLLHGGDGTDNAQMNELAMLIAVMDGRDVNPLSGPDDRPSNARPPVLLDPYAPYQPAGLYRSGIHGSAATIPWYGLSGNHDSYSTGILPFFDQLFGGRAAPLPLQPRPGLLLPVEFRPTGSTAYGNVTPAMPGPPPLFQAARYVEPNPAREYYDKAQFVAALFETDTGPIGHGMSDPAGPSWFSISPVPGLRLIGLDTSDPAHKLPAFIYVAAAISAAQIAFLRAELAAARDRDETVIVLTHHPSSLLEFILGTAVSPDQFRAILNEYPNVVLHLCGHQHRNFVTDRGGYIEIETCSTIDIPQEGRLIELYRNEATGEVTVAYEMFSHLDDDLPPLGEDPLRPLREEAREIAAADEGAAARQKLFDPSGIDPRGIELDRSGRVRASR